MKKIMIFALAAVMSASAFAQNPDALKQIKKAKTVDEVVSLINSNASSMTAAEKAQAYNQALNITMKSVDKANQAIQTNMAMEQMGQKASENVDKMAFYKDLVAAFDFALKCDEFDEQPNDKGKVAPKFAKANSDRLANLRVQLVQGGQDAQAAEDNKLAAECFATYGETGAAPLFQNAIKAQGGDQYLSEVARVGAVLSFQNGDLARAQKLADVVATDPAMEKEAIELKSYFATQNLTTREDSLKCVETLKDMYAKHPTNEAAFSQLAQFYANLGMTAEQNALISEHVAKNPTSFSAWAMQGQNLMNAQKYDDAIESYKKAIDCTVEDEKQKALVLTYIGFCYNSKAAAVETQKEQDELLKQSIPFLEQARQLDPNRDRANWAYPLYQCYYTIYGENDPKTKEVQEAMKY